ncbi:hypothetical protein OC498_15350, partial [Acinetobacter bohemicus]
DLKSSGDIGPASMALLRQTIHEQNSIFNTSQKFVSEKMLAGSQELDQKTLQKILVAPLTQAFSSLIPPAQTEINKLWQIQAYQPFTSSMAHK